MAIELNVNGLFDLTILDYHLGVEVEEDIEKGILDNLQPGEYLISMDEKVIYDINDLYTPLYKFSLDPCEVEYEFDEA